MVKKGGEKPTCMHYQENGNDASKLQKLHPKVKPQNFQNRKDKRQTISTVQYDLGSDSGEETKFIATSLQGKSSSDYVSKVELVIDEKKMSDIFHIRVISKHTKIDTLFYSG